MNFALVKYLLLSLGDVTTEVLYCYQFKCTYADARQGVYNLTKQLTISGDVQFHKVFKVLDVRW